MFDAGFREDLTEKDDPTLYGGGAAIFRITKGDKAAYLTIYNAHNGYYGHGFTFKVGDTVEKGVL